MGHQIELIIITAPSGSGKTSTVRMLLESLPLLEFSVSATTRRKREGESHGVDYYFLTIEEFKHQIASGAFLEWQEVYPDKYYGTYLSEIERIKKNGHIAALDIDVLGSVEVKRIYGERCLSFFIKSPSIEVLRERLMKRGTEMPHEIEQRISKAQFELQFEKRFDHTVINDNLKECVNQIVNIIKKELNLS